MKNGSMVSVWVFALAVLFWFLPVPVVAGIGWLLFASVIVAFLVAAKYGQAAREALGSRWVALVKDHRRAGDTLSLALLLAIIAVEIVVRKTGGGILGDGSLLKYTHFGFVGGALLLLLLARFRFTGVERSDVHKYFVYGFILLYFCGFVTGTMLLIPHL